MQYGCISSTIQCRKHCPIFPSVYPALFQRVVKILWMDRKKKTFCHLSTSHHWSCSIVFRNTVISQFKTKLRSTYKRFVLWFTVVFVIYELRSAYQSLKEIWLRGVIDCHSTNTPYRAEQLCSTMQYVYLMRCTQITVHYMYLYTPFHLHTPKQIQL